MIKLWETGFLDEWRKRYQPAGKHCADNVKHDSPKVRLTMKNLGSAFILLMIGLAAALIVFILEIFTLFKKN
jgi:hypothetical protein